MTVFNCDTCGLQVSPGDGYIHSRYVGSWTVDHADCWTNSWANECCWAIPERWSDILDAHRELVSSKAAA